MLPLLLSLSAHAESTPPTLPGTWVLSEGWMGEMVLIPPTAVTDREDDWIGIVFQPDGRITWTPMKFYDVVEMGGCSNSFGGFSGTWRTRKGHTIVQLSEWSHGGEEWPGTFTVTTLTAEKLVLTPVK